jgi:hypothetical protein
VTRLAEPKRLVRAEGEPGAAATNPDLGRGSRRRGVLTIVGAFVICPCHLPVTLTVLGLALGGTAAGVFLRSHLLLAGTVITVTWAALTWRGWWLIRRGGSCPVPGADRRPWWRLPS